MKFLNGEFEGLIGSDLERDGMYLEIVGAENPQDIFLEIFYSDILNKFSITLFKENIDLELIEEAIEIAKQRLVPIS